MVERTSPRITRLSYVGGLTAPLLGLILLAATPDRSLGQSYPPYYGNGAYYQQTYPPRVHYPGAMNFHYPAYPPRAWGQAPYAYYGYYAASQQAGEASQYPRIYTPTPPPDEDVEDEAPSQVPGYSVHPNVPMYNAPTFASPYRVSKNYESLTPSLPAPASTATALVDRIAEAASTPNVSFHRPIKDVIWVSADYLVGTNRPMRTPGPLVTTGNALVAGGGALGRPGTVALFGQDPISFGVISGVRAELGMYLDRDSRYSIEVDGMWDFVKTRTFSIVSDASGNPPIARSTFNVATGAVQESGFLVSFPGLFRGSSFIEAKSQLGGVEFNGRYHLYMAERLHTDALLGFRYLNLAERMSFQHRLFPLTDDQLTFQGAFVNSPNSYFVDDFFGTTNHFFGAQLGLRMNWEAKWFTLGAYSKLGLGITNQLVDVEGSTTLVTPTGNSVATGGIYAQPSNIGNYSRMLFGIVPEFGVQLGIDLTRHARLKLGYTLLVWDHVVRPAGQIDRNVNPGQAPSSGFFGLTTGPSNPVFRFSDEFFWNQFFSFGLDFHY